METTLSELENAETVFEAKIPTPMAVASLPVMDFGKGETVKASPERTFKTGTKGYNFTGKVTLNGKRYQVCANLFEIHSKPKQ